MDKEKLVKMQEEMAKKVETQLSKAVVSETEGIIIPTGEFGAVTKA